MNIFISAKEISVKWNMSERSVRNYCSLGRVEGAYLKGKVWMIPEDAKMPTRKNENTDKNYLLTKLREEKTHRRKGGVYHKLQIDLTYNSNHIEGNELTHDETRFIYETRTIGLDNKTKNIDDIIETINHFECVDRVIDFCNYQLSERFIKELHAILKRGTSDAKLPRFAVGDYKKEPNIVGDIETTSPKLVSLEMKKLLGTYNQKDHHSLEEIVEFHVNFERIHPFQDGNGRVGRLILLKECLKNNIVPLIITENIKLFYYRGLKEWDNQKGYLLDTCKYGQDIIKSYLDYFNIKYKE